MTDVDYEVIVIGAGQAGIAMSEHLSGQNIEHLVVEKNRVAESWRSQRWDSLVANGPAWHDRFPGMEFEALAPDTFASKDEVAQYLSDYAEKYQAPIRTGVEVLAVRSAAGAAGFSVDTTAGTFQAARVVVATGAFQKPVIPAIMSEDAGVKQLHSSQYRNPEQLPEGAVLVVGAGSSGVQIAAEVQRSGRAVYLSVGPHERPPRSYRGMDFVWWLGVLNKWDAATPAQGAEHVTIAVSGADGGKTVDFRDLADEGVTLLGRTLSYSQGRLEIAGDLAGNIAAGDASYLDLLAEADAYISAQGLDLPEEPQAHILGPEPESVRNPLRSVDIAEAGINSVIWATGFRADYSWLPDGATDDTGKPCQHRGISTLPGLYFLGLPWQSRRGSSFIWGVWHDARDLVDHMQIQNRYRAQTLSR